MGARLSLPQIRAALKAGGRQRNVGKRAQQIQRRLRSPQLTAPPDVVAAYAATVGALVGIIAETNRQIIELEATLATRFEQHPDAGYTSPNQDSVKYSAPGRSASSGTTPNVTPAPSLAATTPARRPSPSRRDANTPWWHVTYATGVSTTP